MRFVLTVSLAVAVTVFCGCSDKGPEKNAQRDKYLYPSVRTAAACIAALEKPDAKRVLLLGEDAVKSRGVFESAGMKCRIRPELTSDIVFVSCSSMSVEAREKTLSFVSDNGVFAWLIDVRGVSAEEFRGMLESFGCDEPHLWMPGADRWLLVGRKRARRIKLSAMLDLFSRTGLLELMSESRCGGMSELFSGYVGTLSEVMPAFENGDLSAEVKPEFFLTKEIPATQWISDEGLDEDVRRKVFAEIRSMQVVRRLVVEGDMKGDSGDEQGAVDSWSRALLRNPAEMFVRERIDRLERNARAFLGVKQILQAMKCYETIIKIDPGDLGALNNFGICMRDIGRQDIAKKILDRVEELKRK
jgi:hypothetical protein